MQDIKSKLNIINREFSEKLKNISEDKELDKLKTEYIGRKGKMTLIIRDLKNLSKELRPLIGQLANNIKKNIEKNITIKADEIKNKHVSFVQKEYIDITANPPACYSYGHFHPLTFAFNEIFDIFRNLGFQIIKGPEIENDWYCFEALNIPPDHPARDMQDSFYLDKDILPRTHTSAAQVRYMEKHKPPIRIIVPGRVYRRESDVTHSSMFHQLEGLLIDEYVTMSDLKGTLEIFVHAFFGPKRKVRFRPGYFPFTEPSMEIDISCGICNGTGCRSCKFSGWLEILGSGMVHPQVLKNSGIDTKKYQGFAFGLGIDRQAMLKYNIDDIRLLYENDLKFLEQF